jgi:hypothetical protein
MVSPQKQRIIDIALKITRQTGNLPSSVDLIKAGVTRHMVRHHFANYAGLWALIKEKQNKSGNNLEHPQAVKQANRVSEIVNKVCEFSSKHGRMPSRTELSGMGITSAMVRHNFDTLQKLHKAAYDVTKQPHIYNFLKMAEVAKKAKGVNKYIITTAVAGSKLHKKFLSALKSFTKHEKAELLILPAFFSEKKNGLFDPSLTGLNFVHENLRLNNNLFISNIFINPTQVDPVTGLNRICQREGSFILASPKQRLKAVPVSNEKMCHLIMSPGAVTKPDYSNDEGDLKRSGYIADMDHVLGALVVEIVNDEVYHVRQVQAELASGSFIDLGYKYTASGQKQWTGATAIVCGDWHVGDTCPKVKAATIEMIKTLKPKIGVFHDVFNGHSINHHESDDLISKDERLKASRFSLESELTECAKDIDYMSDLFEEFAWVKSNHDDFVEKYCRKELYRKDPHNFSCALELSNAMCNGKDPIVHAMQTRMKNFHKIRFLKRDEDYMVHKIQCGVHGDLGANGSRHPSAVALEQSYGPIVSAHSHTPEILRGVYRVGTSTKLRLSYNKGPSSWLNTHCIIYPNGSRQLINIIDGDWGNPSKKKQHAKKEKGKKTK